MEGEERERERERTSHLVSNGKVKSSPYTPRHLQGKRIQSPHPRGNLIPTPSKLSKRVSSSWRGGGNDGRKWQGISRRIAPISS